MARASKNPAKEIPPGKNPQTPMPQDDLWFKDAIIYELHVRSFRDTTGDGIGDFRGLCEKLGYFEELGVTTLWLLPFYPSPMRDDGYDISDYFSVNSSYGTLKDFEDFLAEAHRRKLRVITELVINHTSDQHGWFQRARKAHPGTPERDFYVWSDSPRRFEEARIIFKDFETSNWAWDPVAQSYYWHRFYSHQPDLNFDNPLFREAILSVLDFWLRLGVDGVQLDAVPYLFERDGTSCENLPETHAFVRELRDHVEKKFPGRVLLAETNLWPEDAAAYFGRGDECHMAFHFPLMARLFMALQMEDRFPIIDILEQTPEIPQSCQWAIFLRNHDVLTLEMVTDEERDYMYRLFAEDPRARLNLGIRRRRPLLSNNRRRIELINASSCPCRERRSFITATKLEWATTSTWATAMGFARPCNGAQIETLDSPRLIRNACSFRLSSIRNFTSRLSTLMCS
jgi:maltose alpha-D-glucosyltransferase/alpha-amylase